VLFVRFYTVDFLVHTSQDVQVDEPAVERLWWVEMNKSPHVKIILHRIISVVCFERIVLLLCTDRIHDEE